MNTSFRLILAVLLSSVGFHAQAGLFSLEIVEPATTAGDIGTLQILYHGEEENLSFAVGGLDLKLTSSTAGVIKFLDAHVVNDSEQWDIAVARQTTDNEVGELFAASIFSPGLAPGSQVFAEVKYSLLGSGYTDLLLDVGGEDPLYQGDRGDVSGYVRSRGLCVGDCDPTRAPTEINLGDSWAVLREQLYAPPVIPSPQPDPVTPTPSDPVIDVPPIAQEPEPTIPTDPEPVNDPPVDIPDDGPSVIELPLNFEWRFPENNFRWVSYSSTIDIAYFPFLATADVEIVNLSTDPNLWQLSGIGSTNLFTRNGQLSMYDGDTFPLAYTMAFDTSPASLGSTIIPEPQSLVLVATATLGLLTRRRRQAG
jgi:hypothetical protein